MTSSTQGLGWPERALRRLRPRAVADPQPGPGAPGLGWPGAREISSPADDRAAGGLGSGTADATARRRAGDRATADVPEPEDAASVTKVMRGSAEDEVEHGRDVG